MNQPEWKLFLRKFENESVIFLSFFSWRKNDPWIYKKNGYLWFGRFGGINFAKDVISMYISDPHSERINYKLRILWTSIIRSALKEEINAN